MSSELPIFRGWQNRFFDSPPRPPKSNNNQTRKMSSTNANGHKLRPTPPPTSAIDWDAVGFKVHQVNGHAHVTWANGKWGKPEFRKEELLQIHGFASCINYGQVFYTWKFICLVMFSNVLKD
jgi:hypothetical protein